MLVSARYHASSNFGAVRVVGVAFADANISDAACVRVGWDSNCRNRDAICLCLPRCPADLSLSLWLSLSLPPSYLETRQPTHYIDARPQDGSRLSTSRGTSNGGISEARLRFSVQTLDGHVCDDEDEDSETDDGESETDGEQWTDEDGDDSAGISHGPRRTRQDMRRESEVRGGEKVNVKEEEPDEVHYQRKQELASVLRRLRGAIRRMDGVLTEYEVLVPLSRMNS